MGVSSRVRRAIRLLRAQTTGTARRTVTVGDGSQFGARLVHDGAGELRIGKNCRIGMGLRQGQLIVNGPGRVVIGDNCTIDAAEIHTLDANATITIGADTYLNRVEMAAAHAITVGERCEVGSALIYDTDFHAVQRVPRGEVRSAPIVIGDDVWIAARTAILRGARVGDRSVIGLGVVVTGTIEPDTLVRPGEVRKDPLAAPSADALE